MLLALLLIGCEDATPSWDLMDPFGPADPVAATSHVVSPLPGELDAAEAALQDSLGDGADAGDDGDGFDNPWGPNAEEAPDAEAPAPPESAPATPLSTGQPVMPQVSGVVPSGAAFGLPSSAAWGVRLLGTIPHAQPPRAALGLPDGTEVVVAPGSMLPSVGMVVITVGVDTVQVARVSPAGDHAEVEMVNLVAQYGRTAQ